MKCGGSVWDSPGFVQKQKTRKKFTSKSVLYKCHECESKSPPLKERVTSKTSASQFKLGITPRDETRRPFAPRECDFAFVPPSNFFCLNHVLTALDNCTRRQFWSAAGPSVAIGVARDDGVAVQVVGVRAVDLARFFGHRAEQLLRYLVRRLERRQPFF